MRHPSPLRPGATIALVSPSSKIENGPEKTKTAINVLTGAGYRVRVMPNAFGRWRYMAGTDEERAGDLQSAFDDPSIDGVMCVRGGYGCARLLKHLDIARIAASGKLFIGYSDITALHLAINNEGLTTLHGPMAASFHEKRDTWVMASWLAALRGDFSTPLDAPKAKTLVPGIAEGELIGGCLTLIADAAGTPWQINATGRLMLLEDVGEEAYRIDAMLTHLLNAGAFDGVTGLVIGEMTDTDGKGEPTSWREIVKERLEPLGIPTVIDFPCGPVKNVRTLGLGLRAKLDAEQGTLTFLENL